MNQLMMKFFAKIFNGFWALTVVIKKFHYNWVLNTPEFPTSINPFQRSVEFHIETSHLFCSAKQITGF